ncbi:unnamed protein product [Effrenium voratum]|nr:unnamed protein product [Effrenium voratum]
MSTSSAWTGFTWRRCCTAVLRCSGVAAWLEDVMDRLAPKSAPRRTSPREVASCLWALAKLQADSPPSARLAEAVLQELDDNPYEDWKPQELSNTLWALATLSTSLKVTPHRVAKRLAALSTHRAPEMEGQHLANVSWSLGTWRLDSPRWFQALCEELSRREVRTLEPRHVANILWAMARVGVRSAVLQQLGTDLSKGGLEKFQARDLAASVWAFASLEVLHGDFFRAVAKSSGEKLRSFSDQDLQNLAWAFALAARFGLSCELAALDAYRFNRRDQLERFVDFRVAGPGHFPESFGGRVRAVSGGLAEVAVAVAEEERGARTGETVVLVNEALFALLSSAEVVQPLELDDGGECAKKKRAPGERRALSLLRRR